MSTQQQNVYILPAKSIKLMLSTPLAPMNAEQENDNYHFPEPTS